MPSRRSTTDSEPPLRPRRAAAPDAPPSQAAGPVDDQPLPAAVERLTARQQQVLDLVQHAMATTGAPPTRAEIAASLGFKSANAAEEHLQALARKGAIELVSGTSRGIRLRGASGPAQRQAALPLAELQQLALPLALPLVGRVAAGSPILAQEHIDQTYHVEASLFEQRPDYLLRVRGQSMRDIGILDGDLLAVRKASDARSGQVVVARLGDDVTVKRLQIEGRGARARVTLLPENADFEPIEVGPEDAFAIEGLAVGLIRRGQLS